MTKFLTDVLGPGIGMVVGGIAAFAALSLAGVNPDPMLHGAVTFGLFVGVVYGRTFGGGR